MEVLRTDGVGGVRVLRLAQRLGVTRGSFYWHFDSVDAFCEELKTFWRDVIVVGIIDDAKRRAAHPNEVLNEIGRTIRKRRTDRYDAAMSEGRSPDALDKEYVRLWLGEQGYKGEGPIPEIPDEVRCEAARRYIEA